MTLLFIIAFQWWYFKVTRSYCFLVQFIFYSCLKLISLVFLPTLGFFLLPFPFFFFFNFFWLIAVNSGLLVYSLFNFVFFSILRNCVLNSSPPTVWQCEEAIAVCCRKQPLQDNRSSHNSSTGYSVRHQSVVTDSHWKITVAVSVSSPLRSDGGSLVLQNVGTAGDKLAETVEMTCGGATMMEPAVGYWSWNGELEILMGCRNILQV